MYEKDLQNHKKSDSVKWIITLVAFVLVFVLIGGICYAIFRDKNSKTTFNVDLEAFMELTKEDYKDSIPVPLASFIGADTFASDEDDEVEPFAYIHLISYDESTEELIVIAAGNPYSEELTLPWGIFVRAQNFPKEDVAGIAKSKSVLQDYFINREYEALLYVVDTDSDELRGCWVNMAIMWLANILDSNDMDEFEMYSVAAPSANLKFKTEGTFKPSNNLMKAMTGKKAR